MSDLFKRKVFLILEDDPDDSVLIQRAFKTSDSWVFICRNTSEARAYLHGAGMYSDRNQFPFPNAFVLDIRLGNESGVDFLEWLRSKDEFHHLSVVVLSGAATSTEVAAVKKLGAARVLEKPSDPVALQALLTVLADDLCHADVQNHVPTSEADSDLVEA